MRAAAPSAAEAASTIWMPRGECADSAQIVVASAGPNETPSWRARLVDALVGPPTGAWVRRRWPTSGSGRRKARARADDREPPRQVRHHGRRVQWTHGHQPDRESRQPGHGGAACAPAVGERCHLGEQRHVRPRDARGLERAHNVAARAGAQPDQYWRHGRGAHSEPCGSPARGQREPGQQREPRTAQQQGLAQHVAPGAISQLMPGARPAATLAATNPPVDTISAGRRGPTRFSQRPAGNDRPTSGSR